MKQPREWALRLASDSERWLQVIPGVRSIGAGHPDSFGSGFVHPHYTRYERVQTDRVR